MNIVNIVLMKSLKRIIDLITKFHLRLQTQRIEPAPFTSAAIWRFQLRLIVNVPTQKPYMVFRYINFLQ
jgi:hypothetical protein